MADDNDQSQKTEEPTPRKLEEARKEGQVAESKEINHLLMIMAGGAVLLLLSPIFSGKVGLSLQKYLEHAALLSENPGIIYQTLLGTLKEIALYLSPLFLVLMIAAAAGGVLQRGFIFSLTSVEPKLEKVSILQGFNRIYSKKALVDFIKNLVKLTIIGTVGFTVMYPMLGELTTLPFHDFHLFPGILLRNSVQIIAFITAAFALVAGLDFVYQRFTFRQKMMMSRQELKDEFKQLEGNPQIKAKIRQIRHARAKRRMMAAVPTADVVITNPTHFAVALKYNPEEMKAPIVVAKGADDIAAKIREVAREHGIILMSNPPLARALYDNVEVDDEIPPEHYKTVAQIIGYVFKLKNKVF